METFLKNQQFIPLPKKSCSETFIVVVLANNDSYVCLNTRAAKVDLVVRSGAVGSHGGIVWSLANSSGLESEAGG